MMGDLIELDNLIYHFSTDLAYCVSIEEDSFGQEAERIFLPKSKVEFYGTKEKAVFAMTEKFAEQKGLI